MLHCLAPKLFYRGFSFSLLCCTFYFFIHLIYFTSDNNGTLVGHTGGSLKVAKHHHVCQHVVQLQDTPPISLHKMSQLTLEEWKFGSKVANCQSTKFNSPPILLAIRYNISCDRWPHDQSHLGL